MTRDGRDTLIESLAHQEGVRNTYKICADDGTLVALHVRIQSPGQKKRFVWQQPDGSSGLNGRPVVELPLYGTERIPTFPAGRSWSSPRARKRPRGQGHRPGPALDSAHIRRVQPERARGGACYPARAALRAALGALAPLHPVYS